MRGRVIALAPNSKAGGEESGSMSSAAAAAPSFCPSPYYRLLFCTVLLNA